MERTPDGTHLAARDSSGGGALLLLQADFEILLEIGPQFAQILHDELPEWRDRSTRISRVHVL